MKIALFAFIVLSLSLPARSQQSAQEADKEAAYTKAITGRAEKIVSTLKITDAQKAARLNALVTDEYRNLNTVYAFRDEQLKAAKETLTDKDALTKKRQEIEDATAPKIQLVHDAFIKKLSAELTQEQIIQIKDGLTYNVLPITYKAFLEMIPSLKPAEKTQIMAWLVEAREHAMDAESSEKKHWWFGKYKGRINNYLAAQGYDLQKEGKDWAERIKDRDAQKKQIQTQL
jgi:murein DD-endopeptidase MepM/ murein hydrolase activator NlpD